MDDPRIVVVSVHDVSDNARSRPLADDCVTALDGMTGLTLYQWYLDEDGAEGRFVQVFDSAGAFLEHLERIRPASPAIYDVSTVTSVEIDGARTPELEGALDSYEVTWRGTAQGSIPDVS